MVKTSCGIVIAHTYTHGVLMAFFLEPYNIRWQKKLLSEGKNTGRHTGDRECTAGNPFERLLSDFEINCGRHISCFCSFDNIISRRQPRLNIARSFLFHCAIFDFKITFMTFCLHRRTGRAINIIVIIIIITIIINTIIRTNVLFNKQ
jgi:hypothetical protein